MMASLLRPLVAVAPRTALARACGGSNSGARCLSLLVCSGGDGGGGEVLGRGKHQQQRWLATAVPGTAAHGVKNWGHVRDVRQEYGVAQPEPAGGEGAAGTGAAEAGKGGGAARRVVRRPKATKGHTTTMIQRTRSVDQEGAAVQDKKSQEKAEDNTSYWAPVRMTDEAFDKVFQEELDRVEASVQDMAEMNEVFTIKRNRTELKIDLGSEFGPYRFKIDPWNQVIRFSSPRSGGLFPYNYHQETKTWRHHLDGHDMEGMLVRDLLYEAMGCPTFK